MTVGRAGANGAGSASAAVADKAAPGKTVPDKAPPSKTGQGIAASEGGHLPSVGKLPGPSAPTVQLHLDSINRTLGKLFAALDRQAPAAEYRRQNKFNEKSQIAYGEAHADVNLARSNVRLEIIKEMERGCRPGACGSADLRQRGELIAAAYAGQMGEGDVRDVIEGQQISRVAQGVKRVTEAIKDLKNLNGAQTDEFNDILADAADFVMTPRRGGNPNEARIRTIPPSPPPVGQHKRCGRKSSSGRFCQGRHLLYDRHEDFRRGRSR